MAAPRKTAAQQRAEAAETEVSVRFEGNTYTIARDIPLTVFEALSTVNDNGDAKNPDYYKAVQSLLGVKQWQAWRKLHTKSSELMAFMQTATEAVGAGK